eukprot:COSAG06_NODE_295_length_18175_cov_9.088017_19_plen_233_part_00
MALLLLLLTATAATEQDDVLSLLRALPPLPVPHYAWPFCHLEDSCTAEFMASALPWSDPQVMHEYARITHSLSTYAGLELYSNLTAEEIDTSWEKLAAGVHGTDATIAVQLEIAPASESDAAAAAAGGDTFGQRSPVRPTNTMLAQLHNATAALARANAKLGTSATIGTVMVDQEGWGSGATPAEVTLNNNEVYNVSGASETSAPHSRDGFSPSIYAFYRHMILLWKETDAI